MNARRLPFVVSALMLTLVCGSCGGAQSTALPSPKPSTEPRAAPRFDMRLRSSTSLHPISAVYTCESADMPPPLRWAKVPRNTAEFDLVVVNATNVDGKLYAYWGVAGLSAAVRSLSPGRLPPNAIVGRNGFGHESYQLCPVTGAGSQYVVLLFAPTRRVPLSPGFDVATLAEHFLHTDISEAFLTFSYIPVQAKSPALTAHDRERTYDSRTPGPSYLTPPGLTQRTRQALPEPVFKLHSPNAPVRTLRNTRHLCDPRGCTSTVTVVGPSVGRTSPHSDTPLPWRDTVSGTGQP
jgi:phosphatidylethanolamine-binding protein (PEBP) family uncharacterized protein